MDFIDLLVFFLFIVFSLLGSLRKKKRKQPRPQLEEVEAPQESDFDRALRDIRESLGYEPREEAPTPTASRSVEPVEPPRRLAPPPRPVPKAAPTGLTPADSSFAREEAFERGAYARPHPTPTRRSVAPTPAPPDSKPRPLPARQKKRQISPGGATRARTTAQIRKALRDPKNARQAVLLAEILQKPPSLRR